MVSGGSELKKNRGAVTEKGKLGLHAEPGRHTCRGAHAALTACAVSTVHPILELGVCKGPGSLPMEAGGLEWGGSGCGPPPVRCSLLRREEAAPAGGLCKIGRWAAAVNAVGSGGATFARAGGRAQVAKGPSDQRPRQAAMAGSNVRNRCRFACISAVAGGA